MAGYTPKKGLLDEPTILRKAVYITYKNALGATRKRKLHPCGTQQGYRRHLASLEYACDECKDAHAKKISEQRGTKYTGERRIPAQCGTPAGARRHRKHGQTVCLPCNLAECEARNRRHKSRPTMPKTEPEDTGACGTDKGYQRHGRKHQHACTPCKAAHAAGQRKYQ